MRKSVLAILCSDVHFSLKAPVARAGEPDWLEAQGKTIAQVGALSEKHKAPVLCAGDLFDRWNSPAELINWVMILLAPFSPQATSGFGFYAIPGNHDLPNHRQDGMYRSAFGTLYESGSLELLRSTGPVYMPSESVCVKVCGSRLGEELPEPPKRGDGNVLRVLVTHQYIWKKGHAYSQAPKQQNVKRKAADFTGWDVVVVGDNHSAFIHEIRHAKGKTIICNPGTLMRRKSDEAKYSPSVGLLYSDGSVKLHKLDTKGEKFTRSVAKDGKEQESSVADFIARLTNLQVCSLNFREAIMQAMDVDDVSESVREYILEAVNG